MSRNLVFYPSVWEYPTCPPLGTTLRPIPGLACWAVPQTPSLEVPQLGKEGSTAFILHTLILMAEWAPIQSLGSPGPCMRKENTGFS